MKKLFSTIAVGLLATVAEAADVAAVYEVRAWQGNSISGTAIAEPVSSVDNPLIGGDEVRFVIRLLSTDYKDVTGYESKKPWKLHYVGSYDDAVAWAVNRPKIALAMGNGIIREAEVEDYEINGTYKIYTDIICKYVVQPGDLALPVRFALTDSGTKINLTNGFNGVSGWVITNGEDDPAALAFDPNVDYRYAPQPEKFEQPNRSNTDLSISGFYVRTVDFRDRENEENSWYDKSANVWRAVHAGSNSPEPSSAAIRVTGTPTLSSTVYIWSEDDTIVDLPEGVPMDMPAKDGKSTITRRVHTITIGAGKVDYRFPISAPDDKEGESTVLYLSENPGFVTTSAGLAKQSYLTIPVAVIKKLEPNITVTIADSSVKVPAGNDQTVAATELTVDISAGYTGDTLDVTVTPSLTGEGDPWKDYVRISEANGGAAWTTETAWTGHFANTGDPETDIVNGKKIVLYVYALGADTRTATGANQIFFTPSTEADYFKTMNPATLHLVYEKPKLSVPGTTSAVGNVDYEFDLTVSDNYKNLNDSDGYTIEYKKKASDSKWSTFKGTGDTDIVWKPDAAGVLKKLGEDGKLTDDRPSLKYTAGTYETSFRVRVGSDTGIVSEPAITAVTVSEPARATALVSLDGGKTYVDSLVEVDEGTKINVKVELTAAYEGDEDKCFAFLKAADDETKACVSGKAVISDSTDVQTGTAGMKILRGDTISAATSITLTDGAADGSELRFEVVLCTEEAYDPAEGKQVPGYQSKDLRITSMNVIPTITKITMGNRNTFVTKSGESMHNNRGDLISAPMGVNREFSFEIDEPSTVDRTAVDTDDKKDGFRVEYEIVEFDGTTKDATEIIGNPSEAKFTYAFTSAGEATVTVRLLDKDMRDPDGTMRWGEEFVFYVDVSDHPYVALTDENGEEFSNKLFYENMTGSKNQSAHMFVKLSETASKDLDIKLTVTCENSEVDPYKCFKLGGGGLAWNEAGKYYTLTIKANQPRTEIWLQEADGTKITSETGFSIKAEVTTDTDVPTAPGTKWKDYFTSTTSYATVENCKPEIVFSAMPCAENDVTNAFVVAVGTKCEFKYTLSDVSQDTTTDNPLTVSWTVGGNSQTATGPDEKNTYTFTPTFESPGIQSVQVTVTDKDNYNGTGFVSHQWFFDVQASKKLTTLAHGPASGFSTSALSQKYNTAAGIGKGHVWANGIFAGASGFKLDWNMGVSASAYISAAGYKCGDEDNGNLGLYDEAIDTDGSKDVGGTIATYYTYDPEDKKDSYLYAWLKTTTGEGNGASSVIYGGIAPEVAGKPMTQSPIALPDQKTGDGLGYEDTIMEAIFSKEYREADNCGDINQDGIPDISVVRYGFGIADQNNVTGNDLADVSAYNEDEDLLPKGSSGGNSLVPNAPSGWDQNLPFHALLEIRGFGIGLNARYKDGNGSLPDRDFTKYEEMAFRNYYCDYREANPGENLPEILRPKRDDTDVEALNEEQANALIAFWKDLDRCKWTPENPTNPMVADTDNDGLEDGYEYWFWYGATVGYPDGDGKWKWLMEGRRLDEGDIDSFTPIPPVDIANAFNPTVPGVAEGNAATMGTLATRDFDGDGLTDFEEYVIGTNPVDFDTDGDGMMDGWEVLRGLNPCSNKEIDPNQGPLNPDGDVMAYTDLKTELYPGLNREEQPTITITLEREVINRVFNPATHGYDEVPQTVVYFYVTLDEDFGDAKTAYEDAMYLIAYYQRILPLITDPEERAAIEREIAELEKTPKPNTFKGLELCHFDKPEEGYDLDYILSNNFFHSIGGELVAKNPGTYGIQELSEEDLENLEYFEDVQAITGHAFALLHNQLYKVFGFNPTTGWGGGTYERAYNTLYEYQLFKYRQKVLGGLLAANPDTVLNRFSINTTNPSLPYEIAYGDKEAANTSDNHGADSDADGMPDGWELYVGLNPSDAKDASQPDDLDGDGLTQTQEFAGTTSTRAYEGCESIMAHFDSVWPNKFYPTDPYDSDTDGDGISDWQEGNEWWGFFHDGRYVTEGRMALTFNYDDTIDRTKGFAQSETCYRGGGLNPNSIDTDKDGLPDFWEMQFAGLVVTPEGVTAGFGVSSFYSDKLKAADGTLDGIHGIQEPVTDERNSRYGNGHFIIGGMDGTFYNDYCTDMDSADRVDYRTGTWRDFDFDGDGLQNYQEYMVQAIRSFRYDDGETPLNGRVAQWKDMGAMPLIVEAGEEEEEPSVVTVSERVEEYDYPAFDYYSATNYFAVAFTNSVAMSNLYYEVSEDGAKVNAIDPKEWNWARLGYFDDTPHEWDPMSGVKYMLPPEVRLNAVNSYPMHLASDKWIFGGYVSTDPRLWDSDNDGMDDYWELYHGMSPIYGRDQNGDGRDIIEEMLGITAKENAWTEFGKREFEYDFDSYPWLAGAPDADPDNDKIRNFEEAIMGNLTSPTTSHTDPTPLWMTEPSVPLSITRQSYVYNENLPWGAVPAWSIDNAREYLYTFEGNEGYDTDNDWTADSRELTAGIIAATDPLVGSDPYRRAAIYLGGEDNKGVAYQRTGSYINTFSEKLNSDAAYDMFRQFTVECWVKPEAEGTILERGAVYAPATAGAEQNEEQWRANFRLELKEGKFVGSFDDSAAVPSGTSGSGCIVVSRESAKLGEWTHLALSYDGKELRLYVNGEQQAYALCSLIPANGIIPILQDPTWSTDYPNASFAVAPGSLVIGARHVKYPLTFHPEDESEAEYPTTIEDALTDFFKGYVAEVRIWDGARSETQLRADREKAYTLKDVEANRAEVFEAWSNDAKRNDNANVMGTAAIPPQLMMHYDFTSLPGATKEEDVALVPGGFNPLATFAEDNVVEPALLTPSWWLNKSSVYTDATVLPWIENSVAHLSAMDGSFADSIYWADARASYVPSSAAGYDSFKIPNSANPYGWATEEVENDNRRFKIIRYEEMHPEYEGLYLKWKFASRSRMVGATDLLPLGGAFAKRESDYWDGQGAMTAWTLTRVDSDGDGVPDWYTGDPADYMRALVAGLLPGGTEPEPAYRDLADFNGNGLPDWWEQIYGISGQNGHTDSDKDGLSNYVEYLLNEVYTIPGKSFDPINPKTNGYVPDAYAKLGKLYIADVFTDHDHMDDTWEVKFGNLAAVSPYIYDANKDTDGDGWTNYAEFQADTDPTKNASLAIDGIEVAQYPVPIIEASITYLGEQNVNCPIVVQAWNCADEKSRTFQSIPDAKWTIGETNAGNGTQQTTSNTNGMAKTKFVGMNPGREVMTHLSPGSVVAGSFKLECKDPGWVAVDIITGQGYIYGADTATWEESAHDKMRNDGSGKGDIVLWHKDETGRDIVLGEIEYATGAVTLDFTALPEYMDFAYNLADPTDASRWSVYTYANCYMRFSWLSKPVTAGRTSIYYLGDADPRSETNNSVGHIREGKNNFIVFADTIDANGKYDPGEPFGIAHNVDVGWNYGKLAIELTDTNPVFARYQLTTGLTDREAVYGSTSDVTLGPGIEAPATRNRVRVFRYASSAFNPQGALQTVDYLSLPLGAPGRKQLLRVLMDKNLDLSESGRDYIDEGDLVDIDNGIFDADWQYLVADHGDNDVVSVTYAVMIGDDSLDTLTSTNSVVLSRLINRRFDDKSHRMIPSPVSPAPMYETVVADACPTFKWWFGGTNTSYTAFKINITSTDNKFSWTSDIQLMPPKAADGYYTWKLPFCVGAITPEGKVFANNMKYTWKISAYNAKFKTDSYSTPATFYMNVPEDQLDYGSIDVAVRYFGASEVLKYKNNKLRVQAFETPDFSGAPVAEGHVLGSNATIADSGAVAERNAELIGLPAGNYYVMAYIDTNNNGKRDDWESWGYACVRDQRDGVIYTPKSVKVGPKVGSRDLITVYLDDCDTDQDGLPDAWEWTKSGNLSDNGATAIDQHTSGSYVSVIDLVGTLDDKTKKSPVARGLASLMSFSLGNPMIAPLVMGLDSDAITVTENGTVEVDVGVDADTFRITGIKVENGNVVLKVNAETEGVEPSADASSFYDYVVKANSTVKVAVYRTSSMAEKFKLFDVLNVTITSDGGDIVIPIESGANGGLYYAEIVE